jgi:hypothetical protein
LLSIRDGERPEWLHTSGRLFRAGFSASSREQGFSVATRNERREENQRTFQRANQRLHDIVEGRLPEDKPVPFLCECADEKCRGRVEVGLTQWEDVAEQPNLFLIVAGHPRTDGERIVDTLGPYEIVQKSND